MHACCDFVLLSYNVVFGNAELSVFNQILLYPTCHLCDITTIFSKLAYNSQEPNLY